MNIVAGSEFFNAFTDLYRRPHFKYISQLCKKYWLLFSSLQRYSLAESVRPLPRSRFASQKSKDSIGASLPRTAREMSEVGQQIDSSQLKPGDLVFFNTMRRTFSHVGIYLGDNHFLHAPRTGAEVRVENMDSNYWMSRYNGARRILQGN